MPSVPFSNGLYLCDNVIVDERSRNASLINMFSARRIEGVPDRLNPFHAFIILTGGHGTYDFVFAIRLLDEDLEVYSLPLKQSFPSPLTAVRLNLRIERCEVPAFGTYQAALFANGEWVADRIFQVLPRETQP